MPLKVDGLENTTVKTGEPVKFEVSVSGGTPPYKYAWTKDTKAAPGATDSATYVGITSAKETDAGLYKVAVTDSATSADTGSAEATLTVQKPEKEQPLLWHRGFAFWAFVLTAASFAALMLPIWWTIDTVLPENGEETNFSGVVAVQLVIIGASAIFVGFYLALLELRGRARSFADLKKEREAAGQPIEETAIWDELVKVGPQLFKAFGELRAPAAAMIVGLVLAICSTALAWRALPDPSPATTSTDTTTTGATDTTK
jgi:hypothetical protein